MKTKRIRLWMALMLASLCVCAAFAFVGCNDNTVTPPAEHEHSYTEWRHSDTEHWRVCPDDGASTEKSPHRFVDGKCECGLVDTREFGTVTGKVTLSGGKNADDYSDVTVDFEGDDAIVDIDENGNFTATHVTVGKAYDVTVSKEDYSTYTAAVKLETKDETVTLTRPFALVYQRLVSWQNKNLFNFDMSHMNDADPYISSIKQGDLGVHTRESYDDVAISVWLTNVKDSGDAYPQKGALVKFEGEKYMMLRIHNNTLLRWDAKTWNQTSIENKDTHICDLTEEQKDQLCSEDGIKLTLLRQGNLLYTYLDDTIILNGTKILPEEYADDKVQVGFWEYAPQADKTWKFEIAEDVSNYEAKIPTFDVPTVSVDNGTVEFDKDSYKYGETATITLKPATGCALYGLDVYGKSVIADVANGVYSFAVTDDIDIQATFVEYQLKNVELTVMGLKAGEAVSLDGTVTLTNIMNASDVHEITLTNGSAIAEGLMTPARYKVEYTDDYYEKTITLEKGDTAATVTLNYKRFEAWANGDLDKLDLSHMNDENPYIDNVVGGDFAVITRDKYDDVSVSVWLTNVKGSGDDYPNKGVFVKFDDGKYMILRINYYKTGNNYWLRWDKTIWNQPTVEDSETWICELTADQLAKLNDENGIKLTLLRRGNMLYALLNDEYMNGTGSYTGYGTRILSEEYADDKVQVGLWEFAPKADKTWKFEIDGKVPTFAAPAVTPEHGSVKFDKSSYKFGETVTITVTPDTDYILSSLIVCGKEVKLQVKDNTYSFTATKEIVATATFAEYLLSDVAFTVNYAKLGVTAPLTGTIKLINAADETDVRTVVLESGTATVEDLVTPGEYKVVYTDDYYGGTITLKKGAATATVTLNYKRFEAWAHGSLDRLDFSHSNDANPTINVTQEGDFGVITRGDGYGDVSVSLWVTSTNVNDRQGVFIKFSDGVHVVLDGGSKDNGLYWINVWEENCLDKPQQWKWVDYYTAEQKTRLNSQEGVKLTLVRRGNMLYSFADDKYVHGSGQYLGNGTKTLDEKYTNDKVQVGFWSFGCNVNANWKFEITDKIPTFAAPTVTAENGTVTFDKPSYKYGETATITVTPATDYILSSLIVCGAEVKSQLNNNTYSFAATEKIEVTATFAECAVRDVTVTVNHAKEGTTELLNGTVALTNTADASDVHEIALTNGTATVENLITPGEYKVVYTDDYYEGTFTLEKGATTASVTLNYKRFEAWGNRNIDGLDLSHSNDEDPTIHVTTTGELGVITRGSYKGDVAVSLWVTWTNVSNRQGVFIQFENGKHIVLDGGGSDKGVYWMTLNYADCMDTKWTWVDYYTNEQKANLDTATGVKLTLVRKGNKLYSFVDDVYMPGTGSYAGNGTRTLDELYAGDEVKVGFWSNDPCKENANFKFEITTDLSKFTNLPA